MYKESISENINKDIMGVSNIEKELDMDLPTGKYYREPNKNDIIICEYVNGGYHIKEQIGDSIVRDDFYSYDNIKIKR